MKSFFYLCVPTVSQNIRVWWKGFNLFLFHWGMWSFYVCCQKFHSNTQMETKQRLVFRRPREWGRAGSQHWAVRGARCRYKGACFLQYASLCALFCEMLDCSLDILGGGFFFFFCLIRCFFTLWKNSQRPYFFSSKNWNRLLWLLRVIEEIHGFYKKFKKYRTKYKGK